MKRTFNILSALLGLAITFAACSKSFLDEEVYSSYAPETLKDSLGFEASISGLHNHLSQFFTTSDQQGWLNVWQVGTDIAYAGQQQGIEVPYYNYALLNSNDGAASFTWNWAFRMINNANIIIRNVEDPTVTSLSQAGKNTVNGEARFFRAYAYNILATCFGDVPLVKEPLTAPKTDFVRAPLADVNALIEEDLRFAGENLPDVDNVKANSKGKMYSRANKAMAQQLLAEAYLRIGKNEQAEQQARAVINDGKFSLTTSRFGVKANQPGDPFSDMFIYGNQRRSQGNREAIWVMEMEHPGTIVGGITNNPQQRRVWGPFFVGVTGMKLADSIGGRGLGRLRLNNHVIYDVYGQEDMRNSPYNFRRQFWYNDPSRPATYGKPVPYAGFDTIFRIAPHTTKWYQFDPKDEFGFAMIKDIPLMRLGETYLLLAEALFKQGRLAEAAEALNIIRGRSNASAITASDVTLDFILDERIRELVGEENRRMTLMRTGTLVDRAVRYNSVSPVNQLTGIENKHLLMPVPQSEINLNKDAVLQQNPGY